MKIALRFLLVVLCFPVLTSIAKVPGLPFSTIDFAATSVSACGGEKIQFNDLSTVISSDPVITWSWNFGDGAQSSLKNPEHIYSLAGNFDVTLEIVRQSGASETLTKTSYINIKAALVPSFGNDTAICEGSSILLNAGNPGASYAWSSGESSQSIVVSDADMYIVEVALNGCSRKDTINVNIRPELFPDFSFSVAGNCLPAKVNFADLSNACPGYAINHWLWDFGDGANSAEQNPVHEYIAAGTYTVRLTIFDEFGTPISRNKRIVINEGSTHIVNLGADTTICSGSSIILNAGNSGSAFEWNTGEKIQQIETYSPGQFWVKVTKNGCAVLDTIVVKTSAPLNAKFKHAQQGNCVPAPIQFTDESASCNSKIVEWRWDFGDGTISNSKNPLHKYLSRGAFTATLVVKDNLGLTSQFSEQVLVDGIESPRFSLGADSTTCEGNLVELNVNVPGASYAWNTGESGSSIFVEETGIYFVDVEKDGCVSSDTINVRFNPALIPQFGFKQQADCASIEVKFTDSSQTCSTSISGWQWDFGDGAVSTSRHPSHTYTASGEYLVKLKVTTASGLSLTRSKKIKLGSYQPTVDLGQDTVICFGSVLTLTPNVQNASSYTWNTGETTPEIYVTEDGEYSVMVDVNGCLGHDTIVVRTRFPISPAWGYTVSGKCLPVNVNFSDSTVLTCDEQFEEWNWEFGDGEISTEQNPVHTYTAAGTYTVQLTVRTVNGLMITKTRQVVIENTDFTLELGDDIETCSDNMVQLNTEVTDAIQTWSPAAGLDNPSSQSPIARPVGTVVYTVAVTKCSITKRDSIRVSVNDLPKPMISLNKDKFTAPLANSYKWYRNGQLVAGENAQTISPRAVGKYSVEIFNKQGCSAISDPVMFIPESINDRRLRGVRVKISPNPSRGILQVALEEMPSKRILYSVYNATGRRVHSGYLSDSMNQVDLTRLARGQYYLECVQDGARLTLPFLIQ